MARYLALALFAAFLFSCTTSTVVTGSWTNKNISKTKRSRYKSVFIAALLENQDLRTHMEEALALEAKRRNLRVVKGTDVFASSFSKGLPSKEEMLKEIKKRNCDAIFTITLLDEKTESRYVPSNNLYSPYPTFGWYGGWYGYYGNAYSRLYDPGYYTQDKMYYLESNLFDTDSEKILWSAQSQTTNPTSIKQFSKDYVNAVVKELVAKGFLEKDKVEDGPGL